MWIDALHIEGGVLDGLRQQFSPKLNVLIGGRGTGKSSVIELLRFCLGATSYTEAGEQASIQHALGVLGDGRVTVVLTNGRERVEISRTAQDTDPEVIDEIYPPFVFSQKEIESIGLHPQSRLRLIDDFLPATKLSSADTSIAARIRSATAEIRTLLSEIDDIGEKTAELTKLEEQLEALKKQSAAQSKVHKEIEGHRKALAEVTPQVAAARVRAEVIGRSADRLSTWANSLDDLIERKPALEPWPAQALTTDELSDLRAREKKALQQVTTALEEIKSVAAELEKKRSTADSQRTGLENRARDVRQKIEESQKGASALDKKIGDLTQQISVLKSLVDLGNQRRERVQQVTSQRSKLLEQQDATRGERTKERENVASRLTKDLSPSVRVSIVPYSQHRDYVAALAAAMRGSGLRYNELAERIAETYSPQEIAALAEQRNAETISHSLQITPDRALRVCDALREQAGGALFTTNVEDDVNIELMDGTDFKSVDFLSMGQRCTVVLPVILRHVERIIILDQPEDHLDNAFVVGTLVKALSTRSKGAQSIVATHNPNIPVLGDAEQVIHLDSDGDRCFVRTAGDISAPKIVDAITTIMEGGREAFIRRAEFYAKNLPNAT